MLQRENSVKKGRRKMEIQQVVFGNACHTNAKQRKQIILPKIEEGITRIINKSGEYVSKNKQKNVLRAVES